MVRPIEVAARLGYAARALVYFTVGILAVVAALGQGGETTGATGALQALLRQPFGTVLLGLTALGLACYALWKFVQALGNADGDVMGWGKRAAGVVGGLLHLGLAWAAVQLVLGWGAGGGGEDAQAQGWTAWLMAQPAGRWLVAAVGAAIAVGGAALIWNGWRGKYKRHLALPYEARAWAEPVCTFGLVVRGIVFVMIGGFVGLAAWTTDPGEVRGLGGALDALRDQPYGPWLLGTVAFGLIAFALYSAIAALYRRIDAPSPQTVLRRFA
ncbi:MAG TPA: DUF1206 domain-containing protein [Alphaproteobacteria bacterium]|nr:DUF1206 domain-containing protein [Alphaproteobacteria bacterium]